MLRPATPLSVVLLIAFIMLLFSVISAPLTKFVALGELNNVKYGVFGTCEGDKCSSIGLGYPTGGILSDENQRFDLPPSIRRTLSLALVLHPVAAFFTLALFCLAVAAHMHSPSHSSRYLLLLFLLTLLTFLMGLASFIVDVILFIPHLAFGSYLVLAANIILAISCVVSCAMRRSILGRKARRKRIAENAEMSGENYYNREGQVKTLPVVANHATIPALSNGDSGADSLPAFATFDSPRTNDQLNDERIPLTQRSPIDGPVEMTNMGDSSGFALSAMTPSRDHFGSPAISSPDPYGPQSFGGRGQGGAYGRGGFEGYAPGGRDQTSLGRGGPRARGGYGTPPRGSYGPGGGGMRGPRVPPPTHGYGNMSPSPYGQMPAADGYAPYDTSPAPLSLPGNNNLARAESPPPMPGQAAYGHRNQLRDGNGNAAGMGGPQQVRTMARGGGRETIMSDASRYSSDDQYVPPRAAWNQGSGRNSPRTASPARSVRPGHEMAGQSASALRGGSQRSDYYEDVSPRFEGMSPAPAHFAQGRGQQAPLHQGDYEDVHAIIGGARSPAESERSNFTSISQRGVNPQWESYPPVPNQGQLPRRPVQAKQQRQDLLLNNNPDFQLPGSRSHGTGRLGPGMILGSAYPAGAI